MDFKIEKVQVTGGPNSGKRYLKDEWTIEWTNPKAEEQINRDMGIAPCYYCGSYGHSSEAHEYF